MSIHLADMMFAIMGLIIMIFVLKKLLYIPIFKMLNRTKIITKISHDRAHEEKKNTKKIDKI